MKSKDRLQKYNPDIIIVGAGITGCTIANILGNDGWRVVILEKRDKIGGNCADRVMDNYFIHEYGPHIFHTSSKEIWDYLSEFTIFNNFINSPLVEAKSIPGELFNLPFNMNLFSKLFHEYNPDNIKQIIRKDIDESCKKFNIDKDNPKNLEEQAIALVGYKIYYHFIKFYTEKQWGKKCTELDASIIKRLPLRYTFNNNYFNDTYQGVPINGYSNMMLEMVNSENIHILYNTNFKEHENQIMEYVNEKDIPIVYTGPIDELFDYRFGNLEWRTVQFKDMLAPTANFQGNAVVNLATDEAEPTRVIEHKHFYCLKEEDIYKYHRTVITEETSIEWTPGMEPYYPINNEKNLSILKKYQNEIDKWENLYLIGRLAEYRYKDIGPSISDAMKLAWELKHTYKK